MKTPKQVKEEIAKLEKMKPTVRRTSFFGDNHHDAIDFQCEVLNGNHDREEIYDLSDAGDIQDNVKDAGIEALDWKEDENDVDAPSETWKELVVKK